MGYRRLKITLNHAQKRVKRPRIGITARGEDWRESGLSVCPATGAVKLPANYEYSDFVTSNSGRYKKLALEDYNFTDHNTPAGTWKSFGFDHPDQFVQFQGENTEGVGAVTVQHFDEDQGWILGVFSHSSGTDQNSTLISFGFNDAPIGSAGISIRIKHEGKIEFWKDGQPVDNASLGGSAGPSRATQTYVVITIERGRGQDLVIRSSTGGAVAFRCNWVDPDDSAAALIPASKFWWYVAKGSATVMACPIDYDASGTGDTRVYAMAEAPNAGESLQDFTGSDRFTSSNNAHLIGHPQGGDATCSLQSEDDTGAFAPNGTDRYCRIRLNLTAGNSGRTSPWVWGVHMAYPPVLASTIAAEADLLPLLASSVRLSLPDSHEGLSAEFDVLDPDALDAIAPGASGCEATPCRIELAYPDGEDDPIILLDGEVKVTEIMDAYRTEGRRVSMRAVDKLMAMANDASARETLPFDGMPLCRPVSAGVSAVKLALLERGIEASEMTLPDLGYRLPDVPARGSDRGPTGEWNMAAEGGDRWQQVLERLFSRAPNVVYGMRPLAPGHYGFKAVEPSDSDVPVATRYRTVAAALTAQPDLTEEEAARLLYDHCSEKPLPIEGNEVRVTGYDPGQQAPIAAVKIWEDSTDPAIAPEDRVRGWLGRRRVVDFSDPGLTRMADCIRVRDEVYIAVAAARDIAEYEAQLPCATNGTPVWRGELVSLDDFMERGEVVSPRVSCWTTELVDESGLGYEDGTELPPSRLAHVTGGALLGYGGIGAREIIDLANDRARSPRRGKGFGNVIGVSPIFTDIAMA